MTAEEKNLDKLKATVETVQMFGAFRKTLSPSQQKDFDAIFQHKLKRLIARENGERMSP